MAWIDPHEHFRQAAQPTVDPVSAPPPGAYVEAGGRRRVLAAPQRRLIAGAIDFACFRLAVSALVVLWILSGLLHDAASRPLHGTPITVVVLFDLTALLFFGPLTFANQGQSVGKRLLGLRVVSDNGEAAQLHQLVIRETLWRAVPLILLPLRTLPGVLDVALLAIGALALLLGVGPNGEPFYDRLARTQVVDDAS